MLISHQSSRINLKQQSFLSCGYEIFRLQNSVVVCIYVILRFLKERYLFLLRQSKDLYPRRMSHPFSWSNRTCHLVVAQTHIGCDRNYSKILKRVTTFIWIRWRLRGVKNAVNTLAVYTLPEKFCETVSYWFPFKKTMLNRWGERCFLKNSYEKNNKIRYSFSVWGIILRLLCSKSNRNPKCCSITMDPAQKPHQRGDYE